MLDPELIVPNPELSLREGAIAPWASRQSVIFTEFLEALTQRYGTDIYTPFKELPENFKQVLFAGSGADVIHFAVEGRTGRHSYSKPFEGLMPQLLRRYNETESSQAREEIQQYMTFRPCPACGGARLRPESRAVLIRKLAIHQVSRAFDRAKPGSSSAPCNWSGKRR